MNRVLPRALPAILMSAGLLLGALAAVAPAEDGEERPGTVVAKDEKRLFPGVSGARSVRLEGPVLGPEVPVQARRIIVRVRDVQPQEGNNPFDPRQPVLNFDGIVVDSVEDLVVLIRAAAGGGQGPGRDGASDCERSSVRMAVILPDLFSGNFDLDPETAACRTPPPGISGMGNFSITVDREGPLATISVGSPPPDLGDWILEGGDTTLEFDPGKRVRFVAVSRAGRRVGIELIVPAMGALGDPPPTFSVLSITVLN